VIRKLVFVEYDYNKFITGKKNIGLARTGTTGKDRKDEKKLDVDINIQLFFCVDLVLT